MKKQLSLKAQTEIDTLLEKTRETSPTDARAEKEYFVAWFDFTGPLKFCLNWLIE